MLAWSIAAAQASGLFSRILVSTDDPAIARIAIAHGAEAPFLRPAEISDDFTPLVPVIRHAAAWVASQDQVAPATVCCLFATAPFVSPADLRRGAALLAEHPATDCVFSATTFAFPIFRAVHEQADGTVALLWPEHRLARSQDLPSAFHEAGQFWFARHAAIQQHDSIYETTCRMIPVERHRVQDIDTAEDWRRAELMAPAILGPAAA